MFALNKGVEFDRLGDESVLHLPLGASLALNTTGTLVVQEIVRGASARDIALTLSGGYGADAQVAYDDVMQFLNQLHTCGAIVEHGSLQ